MADDIPSNVFEYMSREKTLGLGMLLSSITFSLVSELKDKVFDPVWEELVPHDFFTLKIHIGDRVIDLGGAAYEIFRWINYATILYLLVKTFTRIAPNPIVFFWMFLPFIILMIMRKLFVYPVSETSGSQITMPVSLSNDTLTPSGGDPVSIGGTSVTVEPVSFVESSTPMSMTGEDSASSNVL